MNWNKIFLFEFDNIIGEPPPSVVWYMDNHLLDQTFIANEKGAVQNTLTIQR